MGVVVRIVRRILLAAVLAVAALPLGVLGTSAPRAPARTVPIKHVVVVYLENQSFDSVLGFWCNGHRGRCPDGGMPRRVRLSNGAVVTPSVDPDTVPLVRHQTIDQQNAIDGGKMDGWQKIPGCSASQNYACVSGYQPGQVPNLSLLAQDFAISDRTLSMQDSPSWFGHLYAIAASTDGFTGNNPGIQTTPGYGWGCDSDKTDLWHGQKVPTCIPDPALSLPNGGAFEPTPVPYVPTILDRLDAAGLSWRLYGGTCATESVSPHGLETCTSATSGYIWATCPSFAECLYHQGSGMSQDTQFVTDAKAGNLPAFSLVTPTVTANSWHNGFSITQGDNYLGNLVNAVMNGPDWSSTAIFITFDDCGCFYDQVPPGTNPDGTPQGPRTPLVIVSPYARAGYTDTTPTTFAGILAYAEHTLGLGSLSKNDASAYDFANAFNYSQSPLKPVQMTKTALPPSARHLKITKAEADDPT
jgi:phospholipase C